jgi:hypothetical protein
MTTLTIESVEAVKSGVFAGLVLESLGAGVLLVTATTGEVMAYLVPAATLATIAATLQAAVTAGLTATYDEAQTTADPVLESGGTQYRLVSDNSVADESGCVWRLTRLAEVIG